MTQWAVRPTAEAVLRFYRTNFYMAYDDREAIDKVLFGEGQTRPNLTREDRLEILGRLYQGLHFDGTAALVRVKRHYLHPFDVQRAIERDPRAPARHYTYFLFRRIGLADVQEMIATLGLELPRTQRARQLMAEIEAQSGQGAQAGQSTQARPARPLRTAGMLTAFYFPAVEERRRATIVSGYLTEKQGREESERKAIAENNRLAVRERADHMVALLDGERDRHRWRWQVQDVLRQFLGWPRMFEMFLEDLRARPQGDYYSRLFEGVEALGAWEPLALLVQLSLGTRFASDPRVVASVRAINAMQQGYRDHTYVPGDNPAVLLRGDMRLGVNQVAGDVDSLYMRAEEIPRLKPERQQQLVAEMERQAIIHAGKIISGQDTKTYTEDELAELILGDAVKAIGGIRDEDQETVDYEESVRLYGVRHITVNGVEQHEVDYEVVTRLDNGKWTPVEGTRGWHSDSEFEYRLSTYAFSQSSKIITTFALVVAIAAAALVAWQMGLLGFLVRLGGGPVAVATSMTISMAIYALTHKHRTVTGFLLAGLEGFLAAVAFRFISPLGSRLSGGIIGNVETASWRRLVVGWLAGRALVGGTTGAVLGPLTLFLHDLVRIATEGGGFSSLGNYLLSAGIGFVAGAVFDIVGSAVLGPLFRAATRTTITTVREVVAILRANHISGATWQAETAGALSRFRAWIFQVLDPDVATAIYVAFEGKLGMVGREYVTGLRLTIQGQLFELANVELTQTATRGLERLLGTAAGQLDDNTVTALLRRLAGNQQRVVPYFELLNELDDAGVRALLNARQLQALADAPNLLALSARRGPAEIAGLLRYRYNNAVASLDDFARRLGALRADVQDNVLNALRTRGTAVTPEALLRIAQAGVALSDDVVGGLARLTRAARNVPQLEALLHAAPDNRIGEFLAYARGVPDDEVAHLLALADNPARGARLLAYADNPVQLHQLMRSAGHDLAALDALTTATRERAGGALRNLLGRPGATVGNATAKVRAVAGDAALLDRTIVRMGQADVESVITAAQGSHLTHDPVSIRRFLQVAEQYNFSRADDMLYFLNRLRAAHAVGFRQRPQFENAIDALEAFGANHTRRTGAPPLPQAHGPHNLAAPNSSVPLALADGTVADIYVTNASLQHFQERHSFSDFWFSDQIVNRAEVSTFWPAGTSSAQIVDDAMAAIRHPEFLVDFERVRQAGGNYVRPNQGTGVDVGGTDFEIGVNLPARNVAQCFPTTGPRAVPVHQEILWGIRRMLQL